MVVVFLEPAMEMFEREGMRGDFPYQLFSPKMLLPHCQRWSNGYSADL